MPEMIRLTLQIIGIVIILFAAYYATYYVGLKASGQSRRGSKIPSRSTQILERFAISRDKSFCVVEVAGKVYIVGITNQSMTLLDTVELSQYEKAVSERAAFQVNNIQTSGILGNRLGRKLASFVSGGVGARGTPEAANNGNNNANNNDINNKNEENDEKDGTFAKSMEEAKGNDISELQSRSEKERPCGSEGEE